MTYIENVFVCMAAPLVVALLSLKRGQRAALVFCLAGMGACLLSAYLNTFFARLYQADAVNAATQIAPVVEEIMKLLPLLFFLAVFEPTFARFRLAAVIVAASFATFENICSHRPNISSVISGYKQPSKSTQSIEITGFIEKSKPSQIIFLYTLLPLTA